MQRTLDRSSGAKRRHERERADLEKKVAEQDAQIAKLCSSLRQLRSFFHRYDEFVSLLPTLTVCGTASRLWMRVMLPRRKAPGRGRGSRSSSGES